MTHPTTYIEAYPLGEVPPAKLTQTEIDRKPWKYVGYQGFSEFVASDDDFFVLRRFGVLSARVLLALQDRLSELEEELQTLDATHSLKTATDAHNGSFRQDVHPERRELVLSIHRNLREYNELVLQCSQIRARPKVPQKDITSISNWFYNNHNAILDKEAAYIEHSTDLFSLVPKVKSPLRALLERSQHFRLLSLWRKSPTGLNHHDQGNVYYSSDNRIERFVSTIVAFLGVVMLITPLWILAFVTDTVSRLSIITAFLVVFWALLALTTVAKSFESLGAAAAYAAVLVVFLQITGHPL